MSEQPPKNKRWLKVAGGILLLLAIFAAVRFLPLRDWIETFNAWVGDLGPIGYLVFIVGYALAAVGFVPGSILTIGAGLTFGLIGGTVAVSVASTTGAAIAFLLARYFLRDRFKKQFADSARFQAIDRAIGREGGKIIFLLRLTPVIPFSLSNYLYGLTAVKFPAYVLASWLGMLPGTVLYVYIGTLGKTGLEAAGEGVQTGRLIIQGIALVALIAVTVLITRIARKALAESSLDTEQVTEG
ncbi:MAG: TVP38/TMEM64 family protein [Opitutales bacterium]